PALVLHAAEQDVLVRRLAALIGPLLAAYQAHVLQGADCLSNGPLLDADGFSDGFDRGAAQSAGMVMVIGQDEQHVALHRGQINMAQAHGPFDGADAHFGLRAVLYSLRTRFAVLYWR